MMPKERRQLRNWLVASPLKFYSVVGVRPALLLRTTELLLPIIVHHSTLEPYSSNITASYSM